MSGRPPKRGRPAGARLSALKRAQLASIKFARVGPWASMGAMRVQRGTPENIARFGATWRGATMPQRALRAASGYTGRGLYTGAGGFWDSLRSGWNKISGRAGAGFKAAARATGYGAAADALDKLEGAGRAMGMGSYTVTNSIVNGGAGAGAGADVIPSFRAGDNVVEISHKEYISDVFGPATAGTFQNTTYSVQPGIERTFPWLSQVAANYEEYTLKQCIFTFRSTVTDFVASNGQVGTIIMATQYNPSDNPFASKQDAMEYDLAMSGKVSCNMLHGVECDPRKLSGNTGKYVRAGPVRSDDDLKQYDWGNLNVCVSNIPSQFANQALGELWVTYTIELRKPKFFVSRGLNILRDSFVGAPIPPSTGGSIVATRYGYAQQNRIGGQLELGSMPNFLGPAPQPVTILFDTENINYPYNVGQLAGFGAVSYTFPATFSGSVIVKFVQSQEGSGIVWPSIVATSNGPSITPINDQWYENAWSAWSASSPTNAGNTSAQIEVHLNISSPTTALGGAGGGAAPVYDNTIYFVPTAQGNGSTVVAGNVADWSIDVAVYNTAFNYASSGNLIVMNPVTDLQEQWP